MILTTKHIRQQKVVLLVAGINVHNRRVLYIVHTHQLGKQNGELYFGDDISIDVAFEE